MNLPFEKETFLVDESLELLLLGAPVVLFTFNFVASTHGFQLGVLNLLRLAVEHLDQSRNHVVKLHNLLQEVDCLSFHLLCLSKLFLREDSNLVVLVKGDVHVDAGVHVVFSNSKL